MRKPPAPNPLAPCVTVRALGRSDFTPSTPKRRSQHLLSAEGFLTRLVGRKKPRQRHRVPMSKWLLNGLGRARLHQRAAALRKTRAAYLKARSTSHPVSARRPKAEQSPLHLLRLADRWLRPRWPGRGWGWSIDLDRQQEDVHDPGEGKVDKRRRPDSEPFRRAAPRDMPESCQVQLNARIGRSELPRVIDSTSKGRPTT
jgi:hypothetical protein